MSGAMIAGFISNTIIDTFSITAGNGVSVAGYGDGTAGDNPAGAFGTMNSGGTLTGGKIIAEVADNAGTPLARVFVRGFSSDPGASWLVSVTVNGVTKTGAAATYTYDSPHGTAQWTYASNFGPLSSTTTYAGSKLIHN